MAFTRRFLVAEGQTDLCRIGAALIFPSLSQMPCDKVFYACMAELGIPSVTNSVTIGTDLVMLWPRLGRGPIWAEG